MNDISIELLLDKVKTYNDNSEELDMIMKAYDYAYKKHFNQKRITGDDYIIHPLNVAYILTDLNADYMAICAALLHDTIEDAGSSVSELEKLFGIEIASLVDSVTELNKINFKSSDDAEAANQRKILVGMANDVRVLIIKMADRLHNMRTLYVFSPEKQKKKAKETLEILTPVAHRLGIYKIKSELEDLSLRYYNPEAYFDIVEKLNLRKNEMDASIGKMIDEVSVLLNEHNISHEIKGRSKSIYSIYNKLNKGRKFEDIYDILALRVLVNTEQECYLAMGLIHSKYKPVPNRFKDFIAMPKTNLYQSLHTTVFGIDGNLFEIQIRTYDMDKVAEYGIASHWSYKEKVDGSVRDYTDKKLEIFRNIIELNESSGTPEEFITNVKKDILFNDSIYVYTPKGDVIELPKGSTTVDFAYRVHSEVGNTMIMAYVNDKEVPFDTILNNGDIVKIVTSDLSNGPDKSWLDFVITSQAKNRIKEYYSRVLKDDSIKEGKRIFTECLRNAKLSLLDMEKYQEKIISSYNIDDINELYTGLSNNKYSTVSLIKLLTKKEKRKIAGKKDLLIDSKYNTELSKCCYPIPGDNIIGYLGKNNTAFIHRINCQNGIDSNLQTIPIKWNNKTNDKYYSKLLVSSTVDNNLYNIILVFRDNNIMLDSISTLNKGSLKVYAITILVSNKKDVDNLINNLYKISGITRIERAMD